MKRSLCALLISSLIGAVANARLRDVTAKIVSSFDDQSVVFRGSGLVFQHGGESYLVTSDHVILHDNDHKTHLVYLHNGAPIEAEFQIADFGRGLALAHLKTQVAIAPRLEELLVREPTPATPAIMMGYPANSTGLLRDRSGQVTDPRQTSSLFVQTPTLLEIRGGHAEFGMSGGVVTNAQEDFLGILSQQIYSEATGRVQNTILVIPGADVVRWLQASFTETDHASVTLTQTTSQLMSHDVPSLATGALNFYYLDPFNNGHKRIIITPNPHRSTAVTFGHSGGDLERYESFLLDHDDCEIFLMGFRTRGRVGSGSGSSGFVSALRLLDEGRLEPLTELACNGSSDRLQELSAHYQKITALAGRLRSGETEPLFAVLQDDLEYIRDVDPYLPNHQYTALKPDDLAKILTDASYAESWRYLENRAQASDLRQAIEAWIATMRQLTI